MMGTDLGNSIVGGEGQIDRKRKASKLLAKYKIGGKVTDKKASIAQALKHKRARLKEKYAEGGPVIGGQTAVTYQPQEPVTGAKPVKMAYQGNSWWQKLQSEIANLTPQSPLGSMSMGQNGMSQTASMPAAQAAAQQQPPQQAQPSSPTGMKRGGKVR